MHMPLLYGKCNDYLIKAIECHEDTSQPDLIYSSTAYPLPI